MPPPANAMMDGQHAERVAQLPPVAVVVVVFVAVEDVVKVDVLGSVLVEVPVEVFTGQPADGYAHVPDTTTDCPQADTAL